MEERTPRKTLWHNIFPPETGFRQMRHGRCGHRSQGGTRMSCYKQLTVTAAFLAIL
jgi:hypothetical protein